MNKIERIKLAVWIVIFQLVGLVLGLMTKANLYPWYAGLNKSRLTPPAWVFSTVWPILYGLLAIAGWALWRQRKEIEIRPACYLFMIQLVMNWAWTPLFFQLHWIGFSLIWISILTFFVFLTIYLLRNKTRWVSWMLVPYFLWLFFATYLNYAIWMLN